MFHRLSVKTSVRMLVFTSMFALLSVACGGQQTQQQAAPAPARETLEKQVRQCTEPEFRKLPYGLQWDCPPAGFKAPVGDAQPVNTGKILAEEEHGAKRGGVIRTAAPSSVASSTLDIFRSTCCSEPAASVGEPLILRGPPPEFKLTPYLAESWEVSTDGLSYILKLRRGVKFHDKPPANGREMEARDVVDTFTYAMGWKHPSQPPINFPRHNAVATLKKIEAVDKYTVKMTLSSPNSEMLIGLSDGRLGTFPEGLVEWNGGKDLNNFPATGVGTGPFVMEEYGTDKRSTWRKHPDYWNKAPDGQPYPYLDGIVLERTGDATTARAALIAGQIDFLSGLGDPQVAEMQRSIPNFKHIPYQGGSRTYNLMNYKNPQYSEMPGVWTDVRVRWALFLMRDMCKYGEIVKPRTWRYQLFFPYWFPESRSQEELGVMPGMRCEKAEKHQDRLKAVALLKEAGYPKGFKMLDHDSASTDTARAGNFPLALAMHSDLSSVMPREYGLTDWDSKHKVVSGPESARVEVEQLYDMRTNDSLAEVTIGITLYADWHCDGGRNYEGHCNNWNGYWKEMWGLENMTFNKMWELQQAELDPAKRLRMIRQMEHYLIWNMAWAPFHGTLFQDGTRAHVMAYAPYFELYNNPFLKALKWTWLNK